MESCDGNHDLKSVWKAERPRHAWAEVKVTSPGQLRVSVRPFVRNLIDAAIFMIAEASGKARREVTLTAFEANLPEIMQSKNRVSLLRQIASKVGIDASAFDTALANVDYLKKTQRSDCTGGELVRHQGYPCILRERQARLL